MTENATRGAGIRSTNTAAPQAESASADNATDLTRVGHADEIFKL
jgi:hypothetical protein